MRCKKGHDHSQVKVCVAKRNRTKPHGIRPFHCPNCSQVRKFNKKSDNWEPYCIEKAKSEERKPCKVCF